METLSSIYKRKYHVDLRDVDFTKKLRLSNLFSLFQDIASLASENLGVGIEALEKKFGVAWILTRIRVEMLRYPSWDEEILIETWPLEPNKIEFDRDYLVKDKNGNIIIKAVSKWVIMDIKERKLRRTGLIDIQYPENITKRAMDGKLGKLKNFGKLIPAYDKVIGYSDIDFNGHLNNSKYVDYIMDCFPVKDHIHHAIKTIDLHFKNEALPGETIRLWKDVSLVDQNRIYIEGKAGDKIVFQAEVSIAEK